MGEARNPRQKGYEVARFDAIDPAKCPCGLSRRAFVAPVESPVSLHRVDISLDARCHYHRRIVEIYYVLEGEGHIELDGEKVPVAPGTAVLIRPGTRHRALGKLRILNVCVPPFDPSDEYED